MENWIKFRGTETIDMLIWIEIANLGAPSEDTDLVLFLLVVKYIFGKLKYLWIIKLYYE